MSLSTDRCGLRRLISRSQRWLSVVLYVTAVTMLATLPVASPAQGICCVCVDTVNTGGCALFASPPADCSGCMTFCVIAKSAFLRCTEDTDCSGGVADDCNPGETICTQQSPTDGFCNPQPTHTPTPTATATVTDTATVTATVTASQTPTHTATVTQTNTVTVTPTVTSTPTATSTRTSTNTRTVTPTATLVPNGGACDDPTDCISGNCVDDTCCAEPSCPPGQSCDNPANPGICTQRPNEPAPALSPGGVIAAAVILVALGALAVRRRQRGR